MGTYKRCVADAPAPEARSGRDGPRTGQWHASCRRDIDASNAVRNRPSVVVWQPGRAPGLSLDAHEVHVWRVHVPSVLGELPVLRQTLAPAEQARAGRYYFQSDRDRFVIARGALRHLLGKYLGVEAKAVTFAYDTGGKPKLADAVNGKEVSFNLSHSGDWIALAFARGHRLGIDIERIRPEVNYDQIAQRFFSVSEWRALRVLPAPLRPSYFFRLWTCKEAYLKAIGQGLAFPLSQVELGYRQPGVLELLVTPSVPDAARWRIEVVDIDSGYAGALVVEPFAGAVRGFDWSWV